jgi:hypothetical protein
MQRLRVLCTKYRLTLIEDAAHAHGALLNGRPVGSLGDLAAFSFYPTKVLGGVGQGGALVTDSISMGTRRCRSLPVICMDMWASYANLAREYAPQAQILFDRFHIVKHLNAATSSCWHSGQIAAQINKQGSCHMFRHTMATLMLEGGADTRFIQAMQRHIKDRVRPRFAPFQNSAAKNRAAVANSFIPRSSG